MLSQKHDFVFYFTPFYKTNAFVLYFNTMASSNILHVHKDIMSGEGCSTYCV